MQLANGASTLESCLRPLALRNRFDLEAKFLGVVTSGCTGFETKLYGLRVLNRFFRAPTS